mgnify:CR=1 FL=1
MKSIREYTIRAHRWETECGWCGAPIFYGDTAYEAVGVCSPCCSPSCAERLNVALERWNDPPHVAG